MFRATRGLAAGVSAGEGDTSTTEGVCDGDAVGVGDSVGASFGVGEIDGVAAGVSAGDGTGVGSTVTVGDGVSVGSAGVSIGVATMVGVGDSLVTGEGDSFARGKGDALGCGVGVSAGIGELSTVRGRVRAATSLDGGSKSASVKLCTSPTPLTNA